MAMQVFGDIGSRHVGDLDLLVPPGFALEAERLLIEDGYRRMIPGFELTPKQTRAYVRHRPHFHYVHPKSGIHLELHWRFGLNRRLFRFTFDELWREKQILRIGGRDIFVLSLKHTILLLCVHGSAHAWFRLFWLNDISHFLINDETLDWEAVMGDAEKAGLGRMAGEAVFLAHTLLASPMPEPVRCRIRRDNSVRRLARKSFYLIRHPNADRPSPFTTAYFISKRHVYTLRGEWSFKLETTMNLMGGAADDWRGFPLPDALFPLYPTLRPFLWFMRWFVPKSKLYRNRQAGPR